MCKARLGVLVALTAVLSQAPPIDASCDQIPGTANTFRGALGSLDRPFAGPGDPVELRLSPTCDAASSGFGDNALGNVVTVAFTPPAGPAHLVVLAADCAALEGERAACASQLSGGAVTCVPAVVSGGSAIELIGGEQPRLRFSFPDTDALVGAVNDERTLAGPAAIAVSRASAPLPCGLAAQPCAAQTGLVACVDALFGIDGTCDPNPHQQFTHFTALPPPNDAQALCVEPISLCTGRAEEMRMTIDAAGNLLVPMSWQGVILSRTLGLARLLNANAAVPAFPGASEPLRIPSQPFLRSFSPKGGSLAPVFEPRVDPTGVDSLVLFGSTDAPHSVLWIARRSPTFQQCDGGTDAGRPCAGDSECGAGVCVPARCTGGSAAGATCDADTDCPGGECGQALFDFASRQLDGVGPIVLPRLGAGLCQNTQAPCTDDDDCLSGRCVTFRIAAAEPVPLENILESEDLLALVVPEAIEVRDLNGDGDQRDDVLVVTDRRTGTRLATGEGRAPGRAATRIHDAPFSYPAAAVENEVVAFLEAEPLQGRGDRNQDGDEFDTFLRVFRAADRTIAEVTRGAPQAVDAALAINGRSVVIEDGLVWFRAHEAARAPQRITRVSISATGEEANGSSSVPALSPDGKHVGFESDATNLGRSAGERTAYIHDRDTAAITPVVLATTNVSANTATSSPALSGDGRYVAVSAIDTRGLSQVFVLDRDSDVDGIFDEAAATATLLMSNKPNEVERTVDGHSFLPRITPNGRFVAFLSDASEVVGLFEPTLNVVVRDRDHDENGQFELDANEPGVVGYNDTASRSGDGLPPYGEPVAAQPPALSNDGRLVAFGHFEQNLPVFDVNNNCLNAGRSRTSCEDILLRDRGSQQLDLISVSSAGIQSNNHSRNPAMSYDGRFTAYVSGGDTLVGGDTNDASDAFVFDRLMHTTVRVSVASDGTEGDAWTYDAPSVSADGRFVAFASTSGNLVARDENVLCDNDFDLAADDNCGDVFVHDRLTGFTRRVSAAAGGGDANNLSGHPSLSADGTIVAFESRADNLVAGDSNVFCDHHGDEVFSENCPDIFVAEPNPATGAADLNGDGDLDDALLQVLDSTDGEVETVAPATAVAVAGDCAAFLNPEGAAAPGTDLNGDGDTADSVAHFYCHGDGRGARNLGYAAIAIALSRERLAVLVSEAGQGATDLNGDGDVRDDVVAVAEAATPTQLRNVGVAADQLLLSGRYLAFAVPEVSQARQVMNDDNDARDRVLHVVGAGGTVSNTGQAVEDFVITGTRVAMRTAELAQGNRDLSGDGHVAHAVMQVFDIETGQLTNTQQTAIPCRLSSCDPRFPYRIDGDTLKFLTLESQQGEDLTGDTGIDELVLQMFNVRAVDSQGSATGGELGGRTGLQVIGSVRAGMCADSGEACVSAAQCSNGRACLVPPGRCVVDLGTPCDLPGAFRRVSGFLQHCGAGQFCVAGAGVGKGRCHAARGPCDSDAQCDAPATCQEGGENHQRLASPLRASAGSGEVLVDAGRCVAESGRACDPNALTPGCGSGERCAQSAGGFVCQRVHGTCRTAADCPSDSQCRSELVVATAADTDADGLADPFDNCPRAANIDQADADRNGVGDACQAVASTPTAVPPQVPTPTATVEPAPATQTPSATPPVSQDGEDGCAIGVSEDGRAPLLLLVGAALLLWRRRCRALLALALLAAAHPASAVCVGDCDGSGEVRVEEIVSVVSAALGDTKPEHCEAADRDANARITVEELVDAVDGALRGCPVVAVEETAAAALALLRGLSRMHGLVGGVSAAVDAVANALECELGGQTSTACQEIGAGLVRSAINADACRKPADDGAVVIDGSATVLGFGQCPNQVNTNGLRFDFDWDLAAEGGDSAPLVRSRLDLEIRLHSISSGLRPCQIKGATADVNGDLTYLHGEAVDLTVGFDAVRAITGLAQFSESCDPGLVTNVLTGGVTIRDAPLDPPRAALELDGLQVEIDRDATSLTINGELRGDCANGRAQVQTLEPFNPLIADVCFTRGALLIENRQGSLLLRSQPDGSVTLDAGADGSIDAMFESCTTAPVQCAP